MNFLNQIKPLIVSSPSPKRLVNGSKTAALLMHLGEFSTASATSTSLTSINGLGPIHVKNISPSSSKLWLISSIIPENYIKHAFVSKS